MKKNSIESQIVTLQNENQNLKDEKSNLENEKNELNKKLEEAKKVSSNNSNTTKKTSNSTSSTNSNFQGTIVYITKTGKKYHRSNCSYLKKSKISININTAKAEGYTACSRCNP